MASQLKVYEVPIAYRPKAVLYHALTASVFYFAFIATILVMHVSQLVLLPLCWSPLYWDYIRFSQESFARLLVWISGGTPLVLTLGPGVDAATFVKRDGEGKVVGIDFGSERFVMVSNHQSYVEWVYTWCLLSLGGLGGALHIILKSSLRFVPLVGPAMQLFSFIFLRANSWGAEQTAVGKQLVEMGEEAGGLRGEKGKCVLLLYPEGTLVSKLTRPGSKRFADKTGIEDLENLLLPRSTGTLFVLRSLASRMPDCAFYDLTIGYPGVPLASYAQSYYTIASIFARRQPPPAVHMHIIKHELSTIPYAAHSVNPRLSAIEMDKLLTDDERKAFAAWLDGIWRKKDVLMRGFMKEGEFAGTKENKVTLPLQKSTDDLLAIAANFIPTYVAYRAVVFAWAYYH